jgi:hypothetical protein
LALVAWRLDRPEALAAELSAAQGVQAFGAGPNLFAFAAHIPVIVRYFPGASAIGAERPAMAAINRFMS